MSSPSHGPTAEDQHAGGVLSGGRQDGDAVTVLRVVDKGLAAAERRAVPGSELEMRGDGSLGPHVARARLEIPTLVAVEAELRESMGDLLCVEDLVGDAEYACAAAIVVSRKCVLPWCRVWTPGAPSPARRRWSESRTGLPLDLTPELM